MRNRLCVVTLAVMFCLVGSGIFWPSLGTAAEWKIAYTPLPGTAYDIFIKEVFSKRLETISGGKLKIKLLPGVIGVLDVLDAVKAGRVDGGYILSTGYYGGIVPKWDITGIPGLVLMQNEDESMPRTINEFLYDEINKEAMKNWNCRAATISWWARSTFFSNKGVSKVEDFKGMKCRAHTVWNARLIEAFGGTTVSMPFGELYTSLERKIVDACTSAIPPIMTSGVYERLKYIDPWPFGASLQIILINTKSIESLPEDLRSKVMKEFHKLNREAQNLEIKMARNFVNLAKKKGKIWTKIPESEMQKYISKSKEKIFPKWVEKAGQGGQKWMDRVTALQY